MGLVNDNEKVGDLSLEIAHAERLLKMPKNGGWKLPKDSLYKLTKDGLIKKSNRGNTKSAQE